MKEGMKPFSNFRNGEGKAGFMGLKSLLELKKNKGTGGQFRVPCLKWR
jgi:hypothetical protein